MQRYTAKLFKTGFGGAAASLPIDLQLVPVNWTANDRGGCHSAELTASGSEDSLAGLASWLGDRVEIYNGGGDLVWWGILWDLEIKLGGIQVDLSMDSIYNRVAVTYPYVLADGSEESRTTDWVEDTSSVTRYGKRELLYGMPSSIRDGANDVRDKLLEQYRLPAPTLRTQPQQEYSARLVAMGLWRRAEGVYFTNFDGLEEHDGESGEQIIGRHLTSTAISFGTSTPGGEADEMHIASGDFLPIQVGDTITVSGAAQAANNDTYSVVGMDASNQISIGGTFTPEAAGATVRVTIGDTPAQDNVAMSFQLDSAWTVTHVAVKVRKLGEPSDSFRIGLYPDDAGVPGTVLVANETLGSALFTEMTWTEFGLPTPVALAANTTYWIGIRRTGSANPDDGYEIAVDEDLGYPNGHIRVYNGTAWVSRNPVADMPFRVIGEIDSTEQLEKALDTVGAFSYILMQVDSNVPIRPYRDVPLAVTEEIADMLDMGTSTGERLLVWVTPDDAVVVSTAEASSMENLKLGMDGKIYYAVGGAYPPGRLVYGRYVDLESLPLMDSIGVRSSRGRAIYVTGSTYDAETETLWIETEGAIDPFQALTIQKG